MKELRGILRKQPQQIIAQLNPIEHPEYPQTQKFLPVQLFENDSTVSFGKELKGRKSNAERHVSIVTGEKTFVSTVHFQIRITKTQTRKGFKYKFTLETLSKLNPTYINGRKLSIKDTTAPKSALLTSNSEIGSGIPHHYIPERLQKHIPACPIFQFSVYCDLERGPDMSDALEKHQDFQIKIGKLKREFKNKKKTFGLNRQTNNKRGREGSSQHQKPPKKKVKQFNNNSMISNDSPMTQEIFSQESNMSITPRRNSQNGGIGFFTPDIGGEYQKIQETRGGSVVKKNVSFSSQNDVYDQSIDSVIDLNDIPLTEEGLFDVIENESLCVYCEKMCYKPLVVTPCGCLYCSACLEEVKRKSSSLFVICEGCKKLGKSGRVVEDVRRDVTIGTMVNAYFSRYPEKFRSSKEIKEMNDMSISMENFVNERENDKKVDVCVSLLNNLENNPGKCIECVRRRKDDGYKCTNNTQHVLCFHCRKNYLPRRESSALPQNCFLCKRFFCATYFNVSKCGKYLMKLKDRIFNYIPENKRRPFGINSVEKEMLLNFLLFNKIVINDVWKIVLNKIDKGEIAYKINRGRTYVDVNLNSSTSTCDDCANDVFKQLIHHFLSEIDFPPRKDYRGRNVTNCRYGSDCLSQFKRSFHKQRNNHSCKSSGGSSNSQSSTQSQYSDFDGSQSPNTPMTPMTPVTPTQYSKSQNNYQTRTPQTRTPQGRTPQTRTPRTPQVRSPQVRTPQVRSPQVRSQSRSPQIRSPNMYRRNTQKN